MREIEFRAKGLYKYRWYYGYYVEHKMSMQSYIIDLDEEVMNTEHLVDKNTLGQYIGLKDKNGTKIFEGDIVKVTIKNEEYDWDGQYRKHIQKLIGKVIYEKNAFIIDSKTKTFDFIDKKYVEIQRDGTTYYYTYEVIGNIYDNPELLEVKQNENN